MKSSAVVRRGGNLKYLYILDVLQLVDFRLHESDLGSAFCTYPKKLKPSIFHRS